MEQYRRFTVDMEKELKLSVRHILILGEKMASLLSRTKSYRRRSCQIRVTTTREDIDGVNPFLREKPINLARSKEKPLQISCLIT